MRSSPKPDTARSQPMMDARALGPYMKRERKILITIILIIIVIILSAPPRIVYARRSQIHENATLIRCTQLLLSRKGSYTGPIDGECNIQTQEAIKEYKSLPPATSSGEICRIQFLVDLNDKLTASLSTSTPEASIRAEIDKLKSDLSNTVTTINGINGGMSTHFVTLSNSMATVGQS
jgi:hypothetical protein